MDLQFDKSASAVRSVADRFELAYSKQPVLTLFWATFSLLSFFPFLTFVALCTIVLGGIALAALNTFLVIFGITLLFTLFLSVIFAFILAFAAGFTCSVIAGVQTLRWISLVRQHGITRGRIIWFEQFHNRGILQALLRSLDKMEPQIASGDSEDTIYVGREEEVPGGRVEEKGHPDVSRSEDEGVAEQTITLGTDSDGRAKESLAVSSEEPAQEASDVKAE